MFDFCCLFKLFKICLMHFIWKVLSLTPQSICSDVTMVKYNKQFLAKLQHFNYLYNIVYNTRGKVNCMIRKYIQD